MKIEISKKIEYDVKTIKLFAKCTDRCSTQLVDEHGYLVEENDEDVPSFFPGEHYGENIIFDIDIETGKILNWKKPIPDQIVEFYGVDA